MGSKAEKKNMEKKTKRTNGKPSERNEPATTRTQAKSATAHESEAIKDPRFSSVHSDPRFQRVPKHQSKVAIDSRFNRMFYDKNFSSSSAPLDKRGKPKNNRNSENPLRHYYRLDEEEEEEGETTKKKKKKKKEDDSEDEEGEEIENGDLLNLASSNESEPLSSGDESESETSSTGSDTDDEDGIEFEEEETAEPEENIPVIEKETRKLAIVNMDWSQVRAVDLYVLMSSFLPKDGQILSVTVYPSEFGLKCMEEEAVHGPIGLFDSDKDKSDDDDDDDEEEEEIDNEKMRAYEKRRMRYYYAVVECDSIATADYLYKTCDGTEFERTSNVLDLRFIPDSMEFKHPPRDVATEAPTNYEGLDFHTRALQHSKINLTWEEDEPQRSRTLRRKFNADQLAELELNEFLASDDGESSDDEDAEDQSTKEVKKERYRALLSGGNGSDVDGEENDKDMEVTFNTGLEDLSKRILEKSKDKKSETVWEAILRKRREKKKSRKNRSKKSSEDESSDTDTEASEQPDDFFIEEPASRSGKIGKGARKEKQQKGEDAEQEVSRAELELLLADEQGAEQSLKGYNLKPKKTKGKKGKDIPSEDKIPEVEYNDPRFSALFKSPLFALDPTDPQYKRSAAYARKFGHSGHKQQKGAGEQTTDGEQMDRRNQAQLPPDDTASKKDNQLQSESVPSDKSKYELSSLVRSVKKKAQQAQVRRNEKPSKKHVPMQSDGNLLKKGKHGLSPLVQSVKKKAKVLHS